MMQVTDIYRWYLVPGTISVVLCNKTWLFLLQNYYPEHEIVEVCKWYVEKLEGRPQIGIARGIVKEQFRHHVVKSSRGEV